MTDLEKSILATIAYHDIFDYPLTGFEIWRLLIAPCRAEGIKFEMGDLFVALDESEFLEEKISHKFGFYFLRGRREIVEKRLRRKKLTDDKWKKIGWAFHVLAVVPFVRGIFVSGSLAMENSKENSDVDIIVVAKCKRIWTVRTFMTLLASVLGVRRHGSKTRNRICLNHYITDKSLGIPFQSLYNAESYAHLVNVYAEDKDMFCKFQKENGWLRRYMPNYEISRLGSVRTQHKSGVLRWISAFAEFMLSGRAGNIVEKLFSKIESTRILRDPLRAKSGGRITIDDTQLEFHPDSHEHFVIPEFNRRMESLMLWEFAKQEDSGLNK